MDILSHGQIIGMDVSRDWLDIHSLPSNQSLRLPNTAEGHARLSEMALSQSALVCFEGCEDQKTIWGIVFPSGGGEEWKLWAALDAAGVATRQLPPAQSEPLRRHWFEPNGERLCCQPGNSGENGSDRRETHCVLHGVQAGCRAHSPTRKDTSS